MKAPLIRGMGLVGLVCAVALACTPEGAGGPEDSGDTDAIAPDLQTLDLSPAPDATPAPDAAPMCGQGACAANQRCVRDRCVPVDLAHPPAAMIPAGTFTMGSHPDEPGRAPDEDQRLIALDHPFLMSISEVTHQQWLDALAVRLPAADTCGLDCPVEGVTWFEAAFLANQLSAIHGLPDCYTLTDCDEAQLGRGMTCAGAVPVGVDCTGYRLPTEAEWEYAARGAGDQRFPWGDAPEPSCDRVILDGGDLAGRGCGQEGPSPVCSRSPAGDSSQGVCDLLGNVWEWVEDPYGPYADAPTDGRAAAGDPARRVRRGANWQYPAERQRVALRGREAPGSANTRIGIRLVRNAP